MDNIIASLIGAISAIVVMTIRDVIVPYFKHQHKKKTELQSLTERYAYPLATSSIPLFYRLREIVICKRFDYLNAENRDNTFNRYKYISSIYRLANMIGWIRALKLEQSNLLLHDTTQKSQISRLVSGFEKSLADGPHAEIDIIHNLATLWGISLPTNDSILNSIATKADQVRNCVFTRHYSDPNKHPLQDVLRKVADSLTTASNSCTISDETLSSTKDKALLILSPKQAWIYRDWQSAIGDTMIKESNNSIRRFDVIGYAEFETLFEEKNKWIMRLETLFEGVEFNENNNDYRVPQLSEILKATASFIIEINSLVATSPFSETNLDDAKQALSV